MNRRQKLVQQQFLNNEEAVIGRLRSVYGQSLTDISEKVKNLTFTIGELQEEYDWMDDDDPKKAQLKSKIQSKIYQRNYQEQLASQVDGILKKMKASQYTAVSAYLDECYTDGFIGSFFDLHGQGIPLITPIDQSAMVRAVQLDSKISKGLYQRLGEDVDLLKKKITSEVSRGISTGMSYDQVARGLAGYTRIGYNNAIRIARTEGHRIQTTAAMDAMESAKDKGADILKQWDATLDSATRESHVAVDGEVRELDKPFSNGLMYPGDPSGGASEVINCRCALLQRARWALEDDDKSFTKFNNFTGKLEEFESPQAYDEFKKAYFSNENRAYMDYLQDMQERYGTRDFRTVLDSMSEREYNHYSKLLAKNPIYNKNPQKVLTNSSENGIMPSGFKFTSEASDESFVRNVKGQYNIEDVKRQLSEALERGNEDARAAMKKFAEDDSIATWDSEDGNYYQDGKVYFNALFSLTDPRGVTTAYFHEFGHLIDQKAVATGSRLSLTGTFGELIRSDVRAYIEAFEAKNGTFGAYRKISQEIGFGLDVVTAARFNGISDIFDGVTDGGICGKYGHSTMQRGYWQKTGALEGEAFAHMYTSMFDSEKYELMKHYFPNALMEFERILKGVI